MFNFFRKRNPLNEVQALRDRAERIGLAYLEELAVKGKITRQHIVGMARTMNFHPDEVTERIPDRRRPSRYTKAVAGLRAAGMVGERQTYDERFDQDQH
jgi:hypothetical protein